jgi:hypothetical protein
MAVTVDIEDLLYWAFRQEKVESRRDAPVDALTTYWAVMALPDPFGQLVRHQSRIGRPPEWRSDPDVKIVHLIAVRHWRERYAEWHNALTVLQRTINGALRDHAVTGPAAPQYPWRDGDARVSYRQKRAL